MSSPITMTPPSGTGTNRWALLSKLFWDQEPSINSPNAISYVLTCLASLLSWSVIWNKNHWMNNIMAELHTTKCKSRKPKRERLHQKNWRYVFFMFIEDHYFTAVKKVHAVKIRINPRNILRTTIPSTREKNGALLH